MNKRLWVVLGLIIVAFFGAAIWYNNSNQQELADAKEVAYVQHLDANKLITKDDVVAAMEKQSGKKLSDANKDKIIPDHYTGNKNAKVTVVEYEDFACSHCQAFHTYADQIQEDYSDRVLFIFRDFSLSYTNSAATLTAAEAAAKAGGNDAFWKMGKQLFQDEKWIGASAPANRDGVLEEYAKNAGVKKDDFNDFRRNAEDNGVQAKIDRDKEIGKRAGVTGTPTWFVNGKKIESVTDNTVREAIDSALKEADK